MNSGPDEQRRRLLELSDERDAWMERLNRAERNGYQRGYRNGAAAGRRQVLDEIAAAQREAARGVHPNAPSYAELDRLRYPPDGRMAWIREPGPEPEHGRDADLELEM